LDGLSHSFPVYRGVHHLFEMSMPQVLKIVVVPHRCLPLPWRGYYQPSFVANAFLILNDSKF
jgi:hypothetical protein